MKKSGKGFTLIEMAIVLVIIGLLLGGVLKGQELITGARVRNLISQQDGIKAAFFGFHDRFRALPGDYSGAGSNLTCSGGCPAGNGNGRIEDTGLREDIFVWTHLTAAGFLNGSYSATSTTTSVGPGNTPANPYTTYIEMVYDNEYGDGAVVQTLRHNLKTGNEVPVEILAETDRKIDDGKPFAGAFQFSPYAGSGGTAPLDIDCVDAGNWYISNGVTNCGAASLF